MPEVSYGGISALGFGRAWAINAKPHFLSHSRRILETALKCTDDLHSFTTSVANTVTMVAQKTTSKTYVHHPPRAG